MGTCIHDIHSLPVFVNALGVPPGDLFDPYQGIDIAVPTLCVTLPRLEHNSSKVHSGIRTLSSFAQPLVHHGIGVSDSFQGSTTTVRPSGKQHSTASLSKTFDSGRKKAKLLNNAAYNNPSKVSDGVWVDSVCDSYSFPSSVCTGYAQDAFSRPPLLSRNVENNSFYMSSSSPASPDYTRLTPDPDPAYSRQTVIADKRKAGRETCSTGKENQCNQYHSLDPASQQSISGTVGYDNHSFKRV